MVQAMIYINEEVNQVLNIIKAKYGLRTKSDAIEMVVNEYEKTCLEPELRPEYKKKIEKIAQGRYLTRAQFDKEVK